MSFLYRETPRPERAKLQAHLRQCADCRGRVDEWRGAMATLTKWRLTRIQEAFAFSANVVKWAAAAMIVVGLGFMGGRLSSAQPNAERMRAEIESSVRASMERQKMEALAESEKAIAALAQKFGSEIRGELNNTLKGAVTQGLAVSGEQSQQLLAAYETLRERLDAQVELLRRYETRQTRTAAELASMRKELETMAVLTETELQSAQQQIFQLASSSAPASRAN